MLGIMTCLSLALVYVLKYAVIGKFEFRSTKRFKTLRASKRERERERAREREIEIENEMWFQCMHSHG
jgi:hypothetical protein